MEPREKLYALLNDFIHNRMGIEQFCSMFSDTFRLEIDYNCLSDLEKEQFNTLSRIAYGYTDNDEEIQKYPGYRFSDKQVVEKVDEVCKIFNI